MCDTTDWTVEGKHLYHESVMNRVSKYALNYIFVISSSHNIWIREEIIPVMYAKACLVKPQEINKWMEKQQRCGKDIHSIL